jgi:cobalamin biosynthesis protein CobW
LGLSAAAEDDLVNRPSHHDAEEGHDHDDFDSFALPVPTIGDIPAFLSRLETIAAEHDVLRIKGFLDVADKPMRLLVQGVGTRFRHHFDTIWPKDAPRAGHLVFIGEKGLSRTALETELARSL